MKTMMIALAATKVTAVALAATMMLSAPAYAGQTREPVSLQISTRGVDFSDPQSADAFRTRAYHQIADICNPSDRLYAGDRTDKQCRRELAASLSRMMSNLAMGPSANNTARN